MVLVTVVSKGGNATVRVCVRSDRISLLNKALCQERMWRSQKPKCVSGAAKPGLGMGVVRPNCVDLDVGPIGGHEVLVDERTGFPDARLGRIHATPTPDLPEQSLAAPTCRNSMFSQRSLKRLGF